jgi:hypothetical protein
MAAWDGRGKAEASEQTQIQPGERKSAGRPKGSKNKKTLIEAAVQTALINELEQDAMEIYRRAAEMAKDGDKTMIKLFLQRLLPELKAEGGSDTSNSVGGIQIVVNQTGPTDVSDAVTINQIEPEEQEDDDEEEEDG